MTLNDLPDDNGSSSVNSTDSQLTPTVEPQARPVPLRYTIAILSCGSLTTALLPLFIQLGKPGNWLGVEFFGMTLVCLVVGLIVSLGLAYLFHLLGEQYPNWIRLHSVLFSLFSIVIVPIASYLLILVVVVGLFAASMSGEPGIQILFFVSTTLLLAITNYYFNHQHLLQISTIAIAICGPVIMMVSPIIRYTLEQPQQISNLQTQVFVHAASALLTCCASYGIVRGIRSAINFVRKAIANR